MKYNYSITDYAAAIEREHSKRNTTYPKILNKMKRNGEDTVAMSTTMHYSNELLKLVSNILYGYGHTIYAPEFIHDGLSELIREYKMRVKTYPRWIWLDRNRKSPRMTQETADYELAVWRELCIYFSETMLGDYQIALNAIETKTRKRKSHADHRQTQT